ncbi:hypothetical protein [Nocardioides bigeumensis]|uniref:TolB family protein n=1 Tax=Nocardioides bigeumensis TaxID=433657 RepID=UPI0031DC7BBA
MTTRTRVLVAVVSAIAMLQVVLMAPVATADPRVHPFRGSTDWVAYQTFRDGRESLWLVHPDGTGDHELETGLDAVAQLPDWSPDGERLAFTTRGTFPEPLFEHDLTSGATTQIFDCELPCFGDDEPAYSPDGSEMAFVRYRGPFLEEQGYPADCALWIGDLTTKALTRVTSDADCDRPYFPRWSPDGQSLTYHRERPTSGGGWEAAVFTIRRDGTGERRLTDWGLSAGSPDWSPDGAWIVFSAGYGTGGRADLVRVRPDGTDQQRLTSYQSTSATQPRYSPDGTWIVFTALKPFQGWPRQRSLWAIPAGGGDHAVIAHTERIYTHGTWQP